MTFEFSPFQLVAQISFDLAKLNDYKEPHIHTKGMRNMHSIYIQINLCSFKRFRILFWRALTHTPIYHSQTNIVFYSASSRRFNKRTCSCALQDCAQMINHLIEFESRISPGIYSKMRIIARNVCEKILKQSAVQYLSCHVLLSNSHRLSEQPKSCSC